MTGAVVVDVSMSVDGFVAGPYDGVGRGLGEGGEPIHDWIMGGPWTYAEGPRFAAVDADRELLDEMMSRNGAAIVGRRMYDVVNGWGDEPAFPFPVFVVTSRPHERRDLGTSSYTFVTDGIASALAQAHAVADGKPVSISGGARLIQQYLAAGLVDELWLHVSPVLVGSGTRLFEHLGDGVGRLEVLRAVPSPRATHIQYRLHRR